MTILGREGLEEGRSLAFQGAAVYNGLATFSSGGGMQMKLFWDDKPFYRGNTHCHTTRSDGRRSPEEVIALYREAGYDFLALTDHRKLSEQEHFEENLLMIPGMEMDFLYPTQALHIVGIGMNESFAQQREKWCESPQSCIDTMRACGGLAILAHPHWSLNTLDTMRSLKNVTAAEIYNTVSGTPWNGVRADSSNILDIASTNGVFFHYVAADDAHFYNGDACRSYIMVQTEELSQKAILEAIQAGRFYASQGPRIHQITVENDTVTVECSPVSRAVFESHLIWSDDRCKMGDGMTKIVYPRSDYGDGEKFVRVHLTDAQGNQAWSNIIHF